MLLACDAGTPTAAHHGDDGAATSQPSDATTGDDALPDATTADDALPDAPDASAPSDAGVASDASAPDDAQTYPPPMACDMDASPEASLTMCPPPISVCAGLAPSDYRTIYYFDWGQCEGGWCTWPRHETVCPYSQCDNGACETPPTM